MKTFMIATCLILFGVFYTMSGGADFKPPSREVATAEPTPMATETEVTTVLEPPEPPIVEAEVTPAALTQDLDIITAEPAAPSDPPVVVASAPTPPVDATQPEVARSEPRQMTIEEVTINNVIVEEDVSPDIIEGAIQNTSTGFSDIRRVAGDRVNMRDGPGTVYSVLQVVNQGTEAEIIEVNLDGWAQIRLLDSGKIGWMAERLLSDG